MASPNSLKQTALVVEKLSMARFRVELAGGRRMLATVSGRLRLKFTRISAGDHVVINISPYDLKLKGFQWSEEKRPMKKEDIFHW